MATHEASFTHKKTGLTLNVTVETHDDMYDHVQCSDTHVKKLVAYVNKRLQGIPLSKILIYNGQRLADEMQLEKDEHIFAHVLMKSIHKALQLTNEPDHFAKAVDILQGYEMGSHENRKMDDFEF